MNIKLLKKIIACFLIGVSLIAIKPIKANAEWKQNSNGWWNSKGSTYSVGWDNINGSWYYFDNNGYMKTGWLQDGANWYYLNPNGSMATNTTIDGCYLNNTGIWVQNNNLIGDSSNNATNENDIEREEDKKPNKNLLSVFYKLDDLSIDRMGGGTQSLKLYYGDDISRKAQIEKTYGMIIVDSSNYNMTRNEIMDCDWEKDIELVKNNGQVKLVVK